jgi:hypothetical protein
MDVKSRRVTTNLHIYQVDAFFVTSLAREDSGLWVEVEPIFQAPPGDLRALAQAISRVCDSQSTKSGIPWDGNRGAIWSTAQRLWSVRWYTDDSTVVVPYIKKGSGIGTPRPASEKDEWIADRSAAVTFPSRAASSYEVAETIVDMAG